MRRCLRVAACAALALTFPLSAQKATDPLLATALALRDAPRKDVPDEQTVASVDRLIASSIPGILKARLPLSRPDQALAIEAAALVDLRPIVPATREHAAAARTIAALGRLQRRLYRVSDEAVKELRRIAVEKARRAEAAPLNAVDALIATGTLDGATVESVLLDANPEIRRLAALGLSGAVDARADERTACIRTALRDSSPMVRYEAVRAWARREAAANGCGPLVDALGDSHTYVRLAAIDALADRCRAEDDATDRLVALMTYPPAVGSWHVEARALVAVAKRAPDRAAISLPAFAKHPVWWVRMYAARAAAAMKDVTTLERLAFDDEENVREAALAPLRTLRGSDSDDAFIAALARSDYQLLRTAAEALDGASPNRFLVDALVGALRRVTAERKETSRDTRVAILRRLAELGSRELELVLKPFGNDFDPVVADEAARTFQRLTGRELPVQPRPLPRPEPISQKELAERVNAYVYLDNGRHFVIRLADDKEDVPHAYARFVRLVRAGYYSGLTFHRVVPNYIVQGGSPGANEYAGDSLFMPDELTTRWFERGIVGISTRGRHTGDAQIFINLVDNPHLDLDYTVLGQVGDGLDTLDTILEGTKITRIDLRR